MPPILAVFAEIALAIISPEITSLSDINLITDSSSPFSPRSIAVFIAAVKPLLFITEIVTDDACC